MVETRRNGRVLAGLLFVYCLVLLLPAGFVPLMESTEARYGEIAWEMVRSGNWLEPSFNGIKHFHKPPLTYWLVAAGYQLFGIGDFGARFFGVVAAGIAVAYLYRLAGVLLDDAGQQRNAALIFATSLLFLAVSRIVATDIYLTCFTVMAQYYLFRRIRGERRRSDALLYGLALGLGFLAKGPIIFLFTLLPFGLAKLFDPEHRRVYSWPETAAAAGAFAAVALPWYLAVVVKNPGLLYYFLKVQTVDRVATDHFGRYEPPWYFVYVLAGTFLPYIFFFLRGALRPGRFPPHQRILFLYVLTPFLVFTLARSKQPTYILPLYGVAAVLTAAALARFPMPRLRSLAVAVLALIALAPAVAGFFYPPAFQLRWWLLAGTLPALWILRRAWQERSGARLVTWSAAQLLLAATVAYVVVIAAAPQMRGYETMVDEINRLDPEGRLDILTYRDFLPSLSLYRNRLTAAAYAMKRETQFQDDEAYREWYLPKADDLRRFLADRSEIFLVVREVSLDEFQQETGYLCETIYRQHKHSAYRCRAGAAPDRN